MVIDAKRHFTTKRLSHTTPINHPQELTSSLDTRSQTTKSARLPHSTHTPHRTKNQSRIWHPSLVNTMALSNLVNPPFPPLPTLPMPVHLGTNTSKRCSTDRRTLRMPNRSTTPRTRFIRLSNLVPASTVRGGVLGQTAIIRLSINKALPLKVEASGHPLCQGTPPTAGRHATQPTISYANRIPRNEPRLSYSITTQAISHFPQTLHRLTNEYTAFSHDTTHNSYIHT